MEQTFSDQIPNIKANANGDWPQSAKHKAPRYEVPAGTDQAWSEFDLNLGTRPGPGRVYIIGLMSGPLGSALPIGSLAIGADDQWLVTGHPEIQEPGSKRVKADWSSSYFVQMFWSKETQQISFIIYRQGDRTKSVQSIAIRSSLNLDSGGRVLIGQDAKNPKKLKDLHSLPPFGSTITGTIKASDMDDPDDDTPDDPGPIDPLPPPVITPPLPPVVQPPVIKPSPPVTVPPFTLPPVTTPPIIPPASTPFGNSGFNFDAFPQFVAAAVAFYPELGKSLGQIEPYIQAIQAGKRLADGDFNISNPNDLISVLQLISLFQRLR